MTKTVPKLKSAEYVGDYCLRLTFDDGKKGLLDLEDQLWGDVFEPLRDLERFKDFRIDKDLQTIVWSNGADLAPEFIYEACG